MRMAGQESFGEFVNRVLREKKLSLSDVERRSDKTISDSYLSYIVQDKGGNLTLGKLKALARGLGVSEVTILNAACGITLVDATEAPGSEFAHAMHQYEQLSETDKSELRPTLQLLLREFERRLNSRGNDQPTESDSASS